MAPKRMWLVARRKGYPATMDDAGSDPKVPSRVRSPDDPGSDGKAREDEESHKERVNRELIELLNELRVALPGVQVLFAFLLTVPFSQGFVTLTASSTRRVLRHLRDDVRRLDLPDRSDGVPPPPFPGGRQGADARHGESVRDRRTRAARDRLGGAMFLVADVVYGAGLAAGVAAAAVAALAWCWFVLPLTRKVDET